MFADDLWFQSRKRMACLMGEMLMRAQELDFGMPKLIHLFFGFEICGRQYLKPAFENQKET